MFSSRVPLSLESNAVALAAAAARRAGRTILDLTVTNPTAVGIPLPVEAFRALGDPAVARYAPEPFGTREAREAVAADYARRGLTVPADRIVLTSSTSEAYSLLFKLLCEPGDRVLMPVPSYPLFEHLTRLDGVGGIAYRLDYEGRWCVDPDSLDREWPASVRALLAVSPNNPTGSVLSRAELAAFDERCADRDAAVILDEVFADYPFATGAGPIDNRAGPLPPAALTFRLGGLSKSAAMPQVKLGWIAVDGAAGAVRGALARLELICDTYLSVSTPVQVAAPQLVAAGAGPRAALLARVRGNYDALRALASAYPAVDVLDADAGWSAVLRVPGRDGEEALVLELLERDALLVHPGFFFDFDRGTHAVVSLLPEPSLFREGIGRLLERVHV